MNQPTLADRNNNPGNLKDPSTGGFRKFNSPQEGYAALLNDLEIKKSGKSKTGLTPDSTLADFSKVYAPSSDKNDPAQYTANLSNHMKVRPDTRLRDLDTGKWAEAIAKSEGYTLGGPSVANAQALSATSTEPLKPTSQPEEGGYKPWIQASPTDSGLVAGGKAIVNTIPSAFNFAKGLFNSINPINTIKNIAAIPQAYREAVEANQGDVGKTIASTLSAAPGEAYKQIVPQGARQLISGDLEGASKTFTEDPFGQVAPFVLAAEGGARLADRTATKGAMARYAENPYTERTIPKPVTKYSDAFGKAVETVAKPIIKPLSGLLNKAGEFTGGVATSLASHLTSLDPQTIKQVLSDPAEFTKIKRDSISRGGLAGEVNQAINTRIKDLQETGKGYDAIRNSNQTIEVPKGFIEETLAQHGLQIKRGKIVSDSNSITRNASDINALQKFYKDWGGKKQLTPKEFLNMREDLSQLSKYDRVTGMGKSKASEVVGRSLRDKANRTMRDNQIQELKVLDDSYAPEVQFLKQVKKDYFNPDGTFKDNAPSRIANAANKAELLKRLEGVMPGITKRINILKAVEDIQRASGIKIGSYGRLVAGGLGLGMAGIPGALVAEILTSPEMAVPILRNAGYLGSKAGPIINALRVIGGDIGSKSQKGLIPILMNKESSQSIGA